MELDFLLLEMFEGEKITGSRTLIKIKKLTSVQQEVYLRYHKFLLSELKPVDGALEIQRTSEMTEEEYNESVRKYEYNMRLSPLYNFSAKRKTALDFMLMDDNKSCRFNDYAIEIFIKYLDQYRIHSSMRLRNYAEMLLKFVQFVEPTFTKININSLMFESGNVPIWEEYYPNINYANNEQKKFYQKFTERLFSSETLDIEGQLAYCFVYLYDVIDNYIIDKDIDKLEKILKNIIDKYGNYHKISSFCYGWLKDAYYLKRRYDKAWEYLLEESNYSGLRIRWEDIINIRFRYSKAKLTGEEYLRVINNKRITAFVLHNEENRRMFVRHIEKYFDDFRESFGKEFVKYYLDEYSFEKIPVHMLSDIEKQYSEENKIMQSAKYYINELNKRRSQVTKKDDINTVKVSILSSEVFIKSYPNVAYEILDFELANLLRDMENNVRVANGIPKIGEGWISETQLFYEIKKEFQGETVVRQGKPKWLKKQRFDVYFPDYNVAVEYQGEQHERPIDFFGGEEAFKNIQRLDYQKRKLCIENSCKLIYVYPKYDKEEVIKKIEEAILQTK